MSSALKLLILSVLLSCCLAANRYVELNMNKNVPIVIPDGSTQAVYCQTVQLDHQGKPWQITRFDSNIERRNKDNIAFIALWGIRSGASSPLLSAPNGTTPNCLGMEYDMVYQRKMDYVYFWKRGMTSDINFAYDEGMPFGNQTNYAYLLLEISYTNIESPTKKTFYDNSGITLRLTDNIRPYNIAFFTMGISDGIMQVPTLQAEFSFNNSVTADSSYMYANADPELGILYNLPEALAKLNVSSVQLVAVLGHTLAYGTKVQVYQWLNGTAPGDAKTYTIYTGTPVASGARYTGTPVGEPRLLSKFDDPFFTVDSWDKSVRDRDIYLTPRDSLSITCTYNTVVGKYGQFGPSNPSVELPCPSTFGTDCEMCNAGLLVRYQANPINSAAALNPLIVDTYRFWKGQTRIEKPDSYAIWRKDVHDIDLLSFNTSTYPIWTGYGDYTDKELWPQKQLHAGPSSPVVWSHNEVLQRAFVNHTVNLHWFFSNYSVIYTPSFNRWYIRHDYTFTDWIENFNQLSRVSSGGIFEEDVGQVEFFTGYTHDPHGCRAQRASVFAQQGTGRLAGAPLKWIWDVPINTTLSDGTKIEKIIQQATKLNTIEEHDLPESYYDYSAMIPVTAEFRPDFSVDFTCLWTIENQRNDILVG